MKELTLEELKTHFELMQKVLSEATFDAYVARFWERYAIEKQ